MPARPSRVKLLLSLALLLLITLPLCAWLLPIVHARTMMHRLGSEEPAQREQALNFILREAPHQPWVLDASIQRLSMLPTVPAIELLNALHRLNQHDRPDVGEALAAAARDDSYKDFLLLMRVVGDMRLTNDDPLIDEAVQRLRNADDEQFATLVLALDAHQRWNQEHVDTSVWLRWITMRAASAVPQVRRSAALKLAEPYVRHDWPEALDALLVDADASVRYAAWYAAAPRWLKQHEAGHPPTCPSPPSDAAPMPAHEQAVLDAIHVYFQGDSAPPTPVHADTPTTTGPMLELKLFEQSAAGSLPITTVEGLPMLQRVLAVRAARSPSPDWLSDAFVDEDPAIRDLACLFAAQRFDADTLDRLIPALLDDLHDHAKCSGAVLAALASRQLDRLADHAASEDVQSVKLLMELALWSAGRGDAMTPAVPALLQRDGFPATTTLLLMLHRNDPRAPHKLLAPDGLTHEELRHLLIDRRFIWVLRSMLPDLPQVDAWADDDTLDRQLAELRAFHWLHRWTPKP